MRWLFAVMFMWLLSGVLMLMVLVFSDVCVVGVVVV